jgi:hypothetical protein
MKIIIILAILLMTLLAYACTPLPPKGGDQAGELAKAERDFDPLAQDRERPITIMPQEEDSNEVDSLHQDLEAADSADDLKGADRPGVTQGYRVQIYLSDSLREASRVLAEAREKFEDEVYLEYDAPYYKVRVGDCHTESEGEELLKIAQSLGYGEAWLVYTVISVAEEPDRP